MDGHDSEDSMQSTVETAVDVQNILQEMQETFQTMSDSIVSKIEDLGNRINELEQTINELKAELGVEISPAPAAPAKPTEEEKLNKEEGSA